MDARRFGLVSAFFLIAALTPGCQLFQPVSSQDSSKPADAKPKDPPEVVKAANASESSASETSKADNADTDPVAAWARNMAKKRASQRQAPSFAGDQAAATPATAELADGAPIGSGAAGGGGVATHSSTALASPPGSASDLSLAAENGESGEVFQPIYPVDVIDRSASHSSASANRAAEKKPAATPAATPSGRQLPLTPARERLGSAADLTATPTPARGTTRKGPVLSGVDARVGGNKKSSAEPTKSARPADFSLNKPESASVADNDFQEMLEAALNSSTDPGFRAQIDKRLIAILAGKYDLARHPLEMASAAQQEMTGRFVESLIAIREGHGGDPASESAKVLEQINVLRDSLQKTSLLTLPTFAICRAVKGFGQYEPLSPPQFAAGRETEFVAYCEIRNFASEKRDGGQFQSRFSMKVAVLYGENQVHSISADDIVDNTRTRRSDCFLSPLIRLPATLAPGDYVARITIHDKIGEKFAETTAKFRVVSKG